MDRRTPSLGQAALTCIQLHDAAGPLRTAANALEKYEPPPRWTGVDSPFRDSVERTSWITTLVTRLWLQYSQCLRTNAAGFPPALYRPYTFHNGGKPFPWEQANPVPREEMIEKVNVIIAEDSVLHDIYKPHAELLLRNWWEELNGWCREYRANESWHSTAAGNRIEGEWTAATAGSGDEDHVRSAWSTGCPCHRCTQAAMALMLERITSSAGFAFSQRVAYEMHNLFPEHRSCATPDATEGTESVYLA